jgi:hypothetical protein
MVDSVKNYGIAGVSANVELGKQGAKIIGSDSSQLSFQDKDGNLENIAIAQGTDDTHGVSKQQMDNATSQRVQSISETVTHSGGNQYLFTVQANTTILSTVIEKTTGNWTGYNDTTNITVGDASDNSRLYGVGFTPDSAQQADETNHKYTAETDIYAYVTQGGASAGNAMIKIKLAGPEVDQTGP